MKCEFHKADVILEMVANAIASGVTTFDLPSGKKAKVTRKMKAFHFHGTKCAKCGLEGLFFMNADSGEEAIDLNLFGLVDAEKDGEQGVRLIMLTVDHIMPLSKGGGNHQENLQVMCKNCNGEKGSRLEKKLEYGFLFRSVRDYVLARHPDSEKRDRFLAEFKELMKPYRIPKTNSVLCGSRREMRNYLEYVRAKYGYRVPLKKIKIVYKPEKQNCYNDGTSGHEIVVFLPPCAEEGKHDSGLAYVVSGHAVLSDGGADSSGEGTIVGGGVGQKKQGVPSGSDD